MALIIINKVPFQIDNSCIMSESRSIQSATISGGGSPYLAEGHSDLSVQIMFSESDPFYRNQFPLFRASLAIAQELSWENLVPTINLLCSYIGKEEYLEWGYCTGITYSTQGQDNKKQLSINFTAAKLKDIMGSMTSLTQIKNGNIIGI